MDKQMLEYLGKKYSDEVKVIEEELGRGGARDFAEYQNLCGVIRGLLIAQREINDLMRKVKDHEDD